MSKLNRAWRPQAQVSLTAEEVEKGYAFVVSSASVLGPVYGHNETKGEEHEYCDNPKVGRVTTTDFQYAYQDSSYSKAYAMECWVIPHIQYVRDFWAPKDEGVATASVRDAVKRGRGQL